MIIATRNSPLALWQANHVKAALLAAHPHLQIDIQGFLTEGDKSLDSSLSKSGGKGLFVKELETALLEKKADIAVHSVKDMTVEPTPELTLAAICKREDPRDAFISPNFPNLNNLPIGATVGTSSSRRACLLRNLRPDLKIEPLRGNVGTRLKKLDEGNYDAIILAAAGLKRLGEANRISSYLEPDFWIPAVGQGAIGIECRIDDTDTLNLLRVLDDASTRCCITAERAFNATLGGGCQLPIAAHAVYLNDGNLHIRGFVANPYGNELIRAELVGDKQQPEKLGKALAKLLLEKGAGEIIEGMKRRVD